MASINPNFFKGLTECAKNPPKNYINLVINSYQKISLISWASG